MPHDHPMLEKIRKLLAKAEDDATSAEEADLYTSKAAQLIADYGIDQALLAADVPGGGVVGDRVVRLEPPYARDKADLLATVADSLRCRCVRITDRTTTRNEFSIHLFGHASDLERAELLFTSLLLQASTWLVRTPIPRHEHKAAFRRSWLAGFRHAIGSRLAEAERTAERDASTRRTASGRSTGLVLADRDAAVVDALREIYPRLRHSRPRSFSGSGVSDGWTAGQRADIGGTRVSGRAPLPLR